MNCTLMHKNIPVIDMQIDDDTGAIAKLGTVHDERHLPLTVHVNKTGADRHALNIWWTDRSIPASRDGIREALVTLGVSRATALLTRCFGLSLSDQYWINPEDSGLHWQDINFFQNPFSKDIGEILFGHKHAAAEPIIFMSPDNTSDGWLRKKWIIADDKRYLMKSGSGVMKQEPFNEVIACAIMRRLGIAHVAYTLTFDNGNPYSLCEDFVTPDTELIPAWHIRESMRQDNRDSGLAHLLRCTDSLGIPDIRSALDQMLTLDCIIANEDRHYFNFGFIRNADTLQWLGAAPVYDSGTSLWYNTRRVGSEVESKPFRSKHAEQIKLVKDLAWFDSKALDGLYDEIIDILVPSGDVDEKRSVEIASNVMKRCAQIHALK